jgi:hypothetical protein
VITDKSKLQAVRYRKNEDTVLHCYGKAEKWAAFMDPQAFRETACFITLKKGVDAFAALFLKETGQELESVIEGPRKKNLQGRLPVARSSSAL